MNPTPEQPFEQTRAIDFAIDTALRFWKDRILVAGVLYLLGALFMANLIYSDQVSNKSELVKLNGNFKQYIVQRIGKDTHHGVYLSEFLQDFPIPSEVMDSFLEEEFNRNVEPGQVLTLSIPKSKLENLNAGNQAPVYGIQTANKVYLNPETSIAKIRHSNLFILIFMFSGSILLFGGRLSYLTANR